MKDGIFYVVFRSSFQEFGEGTVVVKGHKINGGDSTHTYRGEIYGNTVELYIEKHKPAGRSIFKQDADYKLKMILNESGYGFSLQGHVEGNEEMKIEADAKFIGDLTV